MAKVAQLQKALWAIFRSNDAAYKTWGQNHNACKRCHAHWRDNCLDPCICGPMPCRACGSLTADIVKGQETDVEGICVKCNEAGTSELFKEFLDGRS